MYLSDIYTLPASLAGVPGLTVPIGVTPPRADRPALPLGLQLLAAPNAEETLFAAAAAWEAAHPDVPRRAPAVVRQ
jgi:aspartyl-tRNA(Asn)/glutamyl-tRNA(Gln) amidotransferase subunit A